MKFNKFSVPALLCIAFALSSCGNKCCNTAETTDSTPAQPAALELQEVANRTNMGAKIFVTPQPALMIGTYDENGNPDVMMAAWGGQCDGNQVCFRLSPHRTTTNIRQTIRYLA